MWNENKDSQGVPVEKTILGIFAGVALLMLLITTIASISNLGKISRQASAPGPVTDVVKVRSYVNEEDRIVEEYY